VLLDGGDNAGATFGGHRPLKIWGWGKKRSKINAIYDKFQVSAQISLKSMKIVTKFNLVNRVDKNDLFGVEQKKFCEIPSTTNKVIKFTPSPSNFPQSDLRRRADSRCFAPNF